MFYLNFIKVLPAPFVTMDVYNCGCIFSPTSIRFQHWDIKFLYLSIDPGYLL